MEISIIILQSFYIVVPVSRKIDRFSETNSFQSSDIFTIVSFRIFNLYYNPSAVCTITTLQVTVYLEKIYHLGLANQWFHFKARCLSNDTLLLDIITVLGFVDTSPCFLLFLSSSHYLSSLSLYWPLQFLWLISPENRWITMIRWQERGRWKDKRDEWKKNYTRNVRLILSFGRDKGWREIE